jgi:hypothetical protein
MLRQRLPQFLMLSGLPSALAVASARSHHIFFSFRQAWSTGIRVSDFLASRGLAAGNCGACANCAVSSTNGAPEGMRAERQAAGFCWGFELRLVAAGSRGVRELVTGCGFRRRACASYGVYSLSALESGTSLASEERKQRVSPELLRQR